jgi:hypothetical protein
VKFTEADRRRISQLVEFFSDEYLSETPMRIHSMGTDDGHGLGGPPFHPEFVNWLQAGEDSDRKGDHRQRITRVFRKVRRVAPTEWYVLQMVCVQRIDIAHLVTLMNERAEAKGHPERYDAMGVTTLLMAALDKAYKWY